MARAQVTVPLDIPDVRVLKTEINKVGELIITIESIKAGTISFYQYIHDRISGANRIPPMADLVTKAAKDLNLGWSFSPV